MPNSAGLMLYPPCVFQTEFKGFVKEMVDCLGKTYWNAPADAANPDEHGMSSWYAGRADALVTKAKVNYDTTNPVGRIPTLRLKMRTLHHDFGHCVECNAIHFERGDMVKNRLGSAALAQNSERAKRHAAMYMGERRALENLRLSSARNEVLFCMRDKCGDDCLYLPSNPRKTLANTSKFQYRMAAQLELYPGTLTLINMLPDHVTSGASFGCTSMLSGMLELIDLRFFTANTRRFIFNEDGGTENVNWPKHALCMTIIDEVKTLNDILVARLPPEHHHAWADTTISVLEDSLDTPGSGGVETLPDMLAHIQHVFGSSKTYGQTAVKVQLQMANFDFWKFYDGCVDADFSSYGKPNVWRYSRHSTTGRPMAQFKMLIQDVATFEKDEWGPWIEEYITRTRPNGTVERNVRVLRSIPGGINFMLSYPDISSDPGLEPWKEDEDWKRETVFDSLCRQWSFCKVTPTTATSQHGPRDSWDAMAKWYSSHQTVDTMPTLPFTIKTDQGDDITVSGMPCSWSAMWTKLKQFNTTTPAGHAVSAPPANQSTSPPRASAVIARSNAKL